MNHSRLIYLTLLFSLNVACAATPASSSNVGDIEYRLPELKFDIKAEYQLRACGVIEVKEGNENNVKSFIKLKSKADVSPQYVNGSDTYIFSPSTTAALKKRSDHEFSISLRNNGTIQSFNSTVADKTGSIIGNAIKFVSNVLTLGFGVFSDTAAVAAKANKPQSPCTEETVAHLNEAQKYVMAINTHKDTLTKLLRKSTISESDGNEISRLQTTIKALESELTSYRMQHLTIKHTYTIVPVNLGESNLLLIPDKKLGKWLVESDAGLINLTTMELALSNKPESPRTTVSPETTSLLIQKPVLSTYRLCRVECPSKFTHVTSPEELARGQVQVPQWGNQQLVNFKMKTFEKRTVNMTFNEAGAVTKLTWSKPSQADAAMSALAGISDSAVSFIDTAKYGRELAETRALKVETDLISQRNALKEAQNKQDALFSTEETEDPGPQTIQVILVAGDDS
ncbi:hypothetical protein ACD631_04825 [Alteromonas macleodii]|uniref:hypothetical protein n=1 Tax=Alteromonas macleodii TaxID=28108 RepID=UPI002076B42C|nr:hypothetical protein [Alteromonas macleodii]USI29678.1 hypothetical protein NFG60_08275 [Alteromonas macleodii]